MQSSPLDHGMGEAVGNPLSATTLIPSVPSFCDSQVLFSPEINPPDKCIILCKKIHAQQRWAAGLALEWSNHREILSVYFMCSALGNGQVLLPGSFPGVQSWWGREAQGMSQPGGFTGRILMEFGAQWVGTRTNTRPTYVALELWGLPEMNLFKIIWHHMVVTLTLLILLLVLVLKGRCQKIISIKKKNPQQIYFLGPIKATLQRNSERN